MQGRTVPGWYPDQSGRAPMRWWDGSRWTWWESDGVVVWSTAPQERPVVGPEDLASLRFVEEVFLAEARRRAVVGEEHARALTGLSRELAREARGQQARGHVPAVSTPPRSPAAPPSATVGPAAVRAGGAEAAGGARPGPPVPALPPQPGPVARWWAGVRERFDADLTVHGLAYLGVLLLFVGVFGLVAFAFSDVTPAMRPVAELAVAVVPFVAAWVLARSGARFVARTLVAVGGLLVPVMVVTSTVDGFGFPPDLHGTALPVVTGLVSAALAVGYAAWTARRPDSGLGAMVAPVLWFAAAMGATGLARPVPRGEDVAVPGGAQVAVVALAVLVTTVLARGLEHREPRLTVRLPGPDGDDVSPSTGAPLAWWQRLAASALAAAMPGVVVVGVLALVAGASEGWPVLPVVVSVLALAGTVAVAGRFGPTTADVALLVGWVLVALRLLTASDRTPLLSPDVPLSGAPDDARPWFLLAVVLLGVGVAEVVVRRMQTFSFGWFGGAEDGDPAVAQARAEAVMWRLLRTRGAMVAAVVGALVVVLAASVPAGSWWPVAGAGLLMVWAAWRRVHVLGSPVAAVALDVAAATTPVLAVLALWGQVPGAIALLVGAGLVLVAVPLARGLHRRGERDRFWSWWSTVAGALVLVASAFEFLVHVLEPPVLARGAVPLAAVVVAVAVVLGPWRARGTVAAVTPIAWWTWITVCFAIEAPTPVLPIGLAGAGLAAVAVAHTRTPRASTLPAALGSAGHVTGVVALLLTFATGWELVVALACATAGWAVTAALGERGRSPVAEALDRRGDAGRFGPWALTLIGVPATAWAALHESGVLPVDHPWTTAVLMGTALGYAALTWPVRGGRPAVLLPWAAFAAALLAPLLSWTTWPLVASLTVLVVQVLLTRGRQAVMVWTAWAVLTPIVGLTVRTTAPAIRDLGGATVLSGTTITVGAVLAVGALLADRARPGDPRLLPRRPVGTAPAVLGAIQLVLGVVVVVLVGDALVAGVLLGAAAVAVGAVSALSGVGGIGAFAVLLGWVAATALLGSDHPGAWAHVAVAAGMLAVAQGVAGSGGPRVRWARWDVPLAAAAAVPALVGVVTVRAADRPLLFTVVGVLAVAAAVRLRRRATLSEVLGWAGTALVVLGAADAGPGWTAVALAVLAAAHTTLAAVRETGTVRTARQWIGALAGGAAWAVSLVAVGLSAQSASDATAVAGALVVVAVTGAVAAGRLGRSWLAPWSVVGTGLTLAGVLPLLPDPGVVARQWERAGIADLELWTGALVPAGGAASWWHVAAWLLLAGATVLAVRAVPWGWWLELGVVAVLGGLLTGFAVTDASRLTQVTVEVGLSAAAAVALALAALAARRRDDVASPATPSSPWLRPLSVLGVATLVLAAGVAAAGTGATSSRLLLAGVLAAAAVQTAAIGLAWRVVGLRMAAPAVAWIGWALYAAEALGDEVAWYTVPVGLALLAVVAVWRADRRDRGLDPADGGVVALELTGVAFLVVASFAAAFTQSVLHAFVAAGIGVLVAVWGLLTRVRRRFLAGVGIVLAGVVLAVALPLVALLPAWGDAGAWVLVAVVGVLAVLAATFLERGRDAVRGGRRRLLDATTGWE